VVCLCASLLIASLPALSLIFFLGGVDVGTLAQGYALLLALAVCATSTAVYFSAAFRKGHVSLLCTYVLLILYFGASEAMLNGWRSMQGVFALLVGEALVFALLACWAGARPIGELAKANVKPLDDPAALKQRRERWPYYLIDPLRRVPPLPDAVNVLAVQEPRMHPLYRSGWGYRCLYVFMVPAICLTIESMIDPREPHAYMAMWWTSYVIGGVWTVLLHAVSMTMDQELDTMEALRLTSLSPSQFLLGKWLASLRMRWILVLIGLGTLAVANLFENPHPRAWLWQPLSWWVELEILGLAAFAISSFCSRTMIAVALSLVAALCLLGVHLALQGFNWFFRDLLFGWSVPSETWQGETQKLIVWAIIGAAFWLVASMGVLRKWRLER
jgi:hypothetical protein